MTTYSSYAVLLTIISVRWVFTTTLITGKQLAGHVIAPHCTEKCGNITIPYPFGIEDGCYFEEHNNKSDSSFKIKCCNCSNTPIFGRDLEVLKISAVEGELRTNIKASYDCYNQRGSVGYSWNGFNLVTFTLSNSRNILVAIGCDTYATFSGVRGGKEYETGCITKCVEEEDVIDGECSGIGCCQASILSGVNNVTVKVGSYHNHSYVNSFNPCNIAFPVAKDAFKFDRKTLNRNLDYYKTLELPVVFHWTIGRNSCSVATQDGSCLCAENAYCYDPLHEMGYRCRCKNGYSGNPYLPQGCTDINECKGENDCKKLEYCINTDGGYYCKCPKGYHGNGTIADHCVSNTNAWLMPVLVSTVSASSAILLSIFGWWLYSVIKRRQATKQRQINFERNGGILLQQQMSSHEGIVERIEIFTIDELKKATDNFNIDRVLGRGGQGTVYKGSLGEGRVVAVKKSNKLEGNQGEQFINEVVVLSQINHRNILKLLGCCLETEVPLLVYEFIPNGTLFNHIHNPSEEFPITWKMRLQIASDSAGALAYLHSSTSSPIFHRDIKSSNILLDDKLQHDQKPLLVHE